MTTLNNISLRRIRSNDTDDIFNMVNAQRDYLGQWLPFVATTHSIVDTRCFVNNTLHSVDRLFTIRKDDSFIGLIGLINTDSSNCKAEIGYWLSQEYQGQGIMTYAVEKICQYAFDEEGFNRIQIRCAMGNEKSRSIPQKLHFTLEGIEREGERFPDGHFENREVYSLLKKEYRELHRNIFHEQP